MTNLYTGLDAPPKALSGKDGAFAQRGSSTHYLTDVLPTAPPAGQSLEQCLVEASFVQPRRYELPPGSPPAYFEDITRKTLSLQMDMPVAALVGYLSSWSGYNTWLNETGGAPNGHKDPLADLQARIANLSSGSVIRVTWPCVLLLATKPAAG